MKIYIIRLEGQGDLELKVVDEETWNWIHGPSGRPGGEGPTSWEDPFVPKSQEELIRKGLNDDDEGWPLNITSGSWENDRALHAVSLPAYESLLKYNDDTEAAIVRFAAERGDQVEDYWEGYIY